MAVALKPRWLCRAYSQGGRGSERDREAYVLMYNTEKCSRRVHYALLIPMCSRVSTRRRPPVPNYVGYESRADGFCTMWLAILMTRLSVRLGDSGSTGLGQLGSRLWFQIAAFSFPWSWLGFPGSCSGRPRNGSIQ